jgi:hypothetical protein
MEPCWRIVVITGIITVSHKVVVAFGVIIHIKMVELDEIDDIISIAWIRGITACFQTTRPAFIVGLPQLEKTCITCVVTEETAMVLVALLGTVIGTEALARRIVISIDGPSFPSVTLDAEMVVAYRSKAALPCPALKKPLSKRDASRNTITPHLLYSQILILVYID